MSRPQGCGPWLRDIADGHAPGDTTTLADASVVEPRGEIRLALGSYVEQARAQGLEFQPKRQGGGGQYGFSGDQLPPGLRQPAE
jgi:hypothetical protein